MLGKPRNKKQKTERNPARLPVRGRETAEDPPTRKNLESESEKPTPGPAEPWEPRVRRVSNQAAQDRKKQANVQTELIHCSLQTA